MWFNNSKIVQYIFVIYHHYIISYHKHAASVLFLFVIPAYSVKAQRPDIKLGNELSYAQFENVRAIRTEGKYLIAFEDNCYRWNVAGLSSALDLISTYAKGKPVTVFLLNKGIPQIKIDISNTNVISSISSRKSEVLEDEFNVSYATGDEWEVLKNIAPINPPENKIDLVIYPQFGLRNMTLSQIYEIQFNLAPTLEVSLWKGMYFTGQVIFPIVDDLTTQKYNIRPGFVTLSQNFRLPFAIFGRATIGNFSSNRYGIDINIEHPFAYTNWTVGFNAGLTGKSEFRNGQWITGEANTQTWFVKTGYFYSNLDVKFDLSYGKYLNGDRGFRADCTRHIGANTVGFFAMRSGGKINGGFHFSVPILPIKRNRKHALRVIPTRFIDWEYNAGTEFYYGKTYETRPNENKSEHFINPDYIRNEILNYIQ